MVRNVTMLQRLLRRDSIFCIKHLGQLIEVCFQLDIINVGCYTGPVVRLLGRRCNVDEVSDILILRI